MAAIAAAMVSFGFIACSQDEDINPNVNYNPVNSEVKNAAPGQIAFTAITNQGPATRGIEVAGANQVENFQVFGFLTDGTQYVGAALDEGIMIDGALGTGEHAADYVSWDYRTASDVAYWPQATVKFQAIYPAEDDCFEIEETALSSNNQQLTAVVTVPTTVADQKDIMFAKTSADGTTHTSESNPAVGLTFDHAMSQIVFKGKVASDKISVTVSDIAIKNVIAEGKVGYFGASQALSSDVTGKYKNTDYSIGLVETPTLGASDVSTAKNLTATNGALFMLPQANTAWTTTAAEPVTVAAAAGSVSSNGQGILAITCHIASAGQDLVGTSSEHETVYIPFAYTWQQGYKYIYTLVFGKGSGAFDEDGNPLDTMLPISYTVSSINGWTAGATEPIEF